MNKDNLNTSYGFNGVSSRPSLTRPSIGNEMGGRGSITS